MLKRKNSLRGSSIMEFPQSKLFPSNKQVTFRECSVRLVDTHINSEEQHSCANSQLEYESIILSPSQGKENIDPMARTKTKKDVRVDSEICELRIQEDRSVIKGNLRSSKYKCIKCTASFSHMDRMDYHMKIIHNVEGQPSYTNIKLEKDDEEFLSSKSAEDSFNDQMAVYNSSKFSIVSKDKYIMNMTHPCLNCDELFFSSKKLQTHIKSAHQPLKCFECPLTFPTKLKMKNHILKKHTSVVKHSCHLCVKSFTDKADLKIHLTITHQLEENSKISNLNEKEFQLKAFQTNDEGIQLSLNDACKTSALKENLSMYDNHHKYDETSLRTAELDGNPSYTANATIGEAEHFNSNIAFDEFLTEYICRLCQSYFSKKEEASIHLKEVHDKINDYICFDCNELFTQTGLLREHIEKLHKPLNVFICDGCKISFSGKSQVSFHLKDCAMDISNRPKDSTSPICATCSRVFVSRENLQKHIKCVHKKIKPYTCDECGKPFFSRQKVQRHARAVHEKLKPYGCKHCDKFFSTPGNRKQHDEAVHQKIRSHLCEHCQISFTSRAAMKQHVISVHMKLKPFKCTYCDAAFSLKVVCQQHEYSVHLKLKLFKCEKCGVSYGWQRSLSKHRCSAN